MPREYGKLFTRAWGDPDFRALTSSAQALYQQLISQPDLSMAGVLTTAPERWAGQSADGTVRRVKAALKELEQRRFILSDATTGETAVRSYVRLDLAWRSPKTMVAVDFAIRSVLSESLRCVIIRELARCDVEGLSSGATREAVGGRIDALVRDHIGDSPDRVSDTLSDTVSDTVSDTLFRVEPPSTSTSTSTSTGTSTSTSTPAATADAFREWWEHWPRKVSIGDARKAFPAALAAAGLAELIAGADRYAAWVQRNRIEDRFIVGPGRWLREERWGDELIDRQQNPDKPTATDRMRMGFDVVQRMEAREAEAEAQQLRLGGTR